MPVENCDVLIVGAGPAGLTAAVYLARYRRKVLVVHDGASRAARIPLTHNVPGFPGGIAGPDLLRQMREQAELYGAVLRQDEIQTLAHDEEEGFAAQGAHSRYRAASVILATGVRLNQIDLPEADHEDAICSACLRYCPICDGYEATGKRVAVLGSSTHGAREALFLRHYSKHLTLLTREGCELSDAQRRELATAGVEVLDAPVAAFRPGPQAMEVELSDGRRLTFDVLYPALGASPRSELAAQLGLTLSEGGCIPTDACQRLPIPGLFAAGDVVEALDQISVAIGHGAIAATQAHNFLREREGRVLQAE
ncbi:NAD(P)/FAD-dependent oxidoreductase [Phenylobacterium sp. J426]|uniref:NAD(P)/FAD-dependent oxidoreductase n=1 Tax=Phenylobacterium sp. J426 TaxID=2898439 RepID=UPI002150AB6C|nr:NAD(P)/FAD-dependent oxidoreductase [Phenylobacterium sp. J426]MCR5876596.1 NAD(P)/FAD-dependent oxidoreductase [Phenylobacterium sp. J426]